VLLPQPAVVTVERIESSAAELRIWARPKADWMPCPGCRARSRRVHRRYQRRLADLAVGGRQMMLMLRVRLFVCQDWNCPVRASPSRSRAWPRRMPDAAADCVRCWNRSGWPWPHQLAVTLRSERIAADPRTRSLLRWVSDSPCS
jgi:transposase